MTNRTKGSLTHKRCLISLMALAMALTLLLPAAGLGETLARVVNPNGGSYVNLRAGRSYEAAILARCPVGSSVEIITKGEWHVVRYQGVKGYMHSNFVSLSAQGGTIQTANANATIATRNGGRLNLRDDASASANVLGSFNPGTRVRVLTHGKTWCRVQVGSSYGYMSSQYLRFDGMSASPSAPTPAIKGYAAVVNNPGSAQVLNLRREASVASQSLGQYRNGVAVTVLGVGKEWHRVNVDGKTGYMAANYVKIADASASPYKSVVNKDSSYVNLRSGAGYDHAVLERVDNGEAVIVLAPGANWSRVNVGGLTGYMMSSFLK